MDKSKERKNGVILSYFSIIINVLIQLLYTPFLLKMLGQNEYGLYSLISTIIGSLTVLDLGFGNAIVVYTVKYRAQKKYEEERKLYGMFLIIFNIIGVLAAIIGIILFFNIDLIFGTSLNHFEINKAKIMMLILSLNLFITFSFNIYSSIITAYEKFTFQKTLIIINSLLKPIIMIPLLFLGYKSITLCIIITIVNIITLFSNYIYCKNKLNINISFQGFDKKIFIEIMGYSFFIFLGVVVDKINWSVDQFILGAISGTMAVSIYSIASQLNSLFINLSTAISNVLLPKVSMMITQNTNNEELTNEFIKVGRIQFLIIFLMISDLVLFGKEFIITWAGNNYSEAYYIAIILIIPMTIPLIQNLGISIMQAKNLHKFRSTLYFFIAIFNIFISIPLAKNFGGIGSALGTSISLVIGSVIIINIYYYKKIGLDIPRFWKNILKMGLFYLIPVIIIIIIMHFITLNGYIYIIIFGTIYSIIYFITNYFLVMNDYEKELVKKILKRFNITKVN